MVEGGAELVQLLLGDALAVTGQNLVLNLVDRPVHWGEENDIWFIGTIILLFFPGQRGAPRKGSGKGQSVKV